MPGETLGLVGESLAVVRSTLGPLYCQALQSDCGEDSLSRYGPDLASLGQKALLPYRRDIQMIFQDPMESLNARHTVQEILEEPLVIHGIGSASDRRKEVNPRLLDLVGLPKRSATRFPFEFFWWSTAENQIARAIAP